MKALEIREKYLNFFKNHHHEIIKGAPLLPENDPTVLFTTAGMHPLVSYLSGAASHPSGKRLVDFQKCLRTDDIDDVGDNRHLTFFEMLGNWSIGDYFKQDSISMSYEFLTKELQIPVEKLSVTCFAGDENAPKDLEAASMWERLGIPKERIYFFGKKQNWWGPAGVTGPCGPDTEIFYDTGKHACSQQCDPDCDCGKYVEIWNNVFMEYFKNQDGTYEPLKNKNVDTGLGLERMTFLLQQKKNVFETELFVPIISALIELNGQKTDEQSYESYRIIADHLRASAMLIVDGVVPSNVEQGYILRRLIRRVIRHLRKLSIDVEKLEEIVQVVINTLSPMYAEVVEQKQDILMQVVKEKNRFMNTLVKGEKEFTKIVDEMTKTGSNMMEGEVLFKLYDTYGFPPEVTKELAKENDILVDMKGFDVCFEKHQELSRQTSAGMFKGGLADHSDETTNYHTAAHLMLAALRKVLGDHVYQKGSNITAERIRFDFTNPEKVSEENLRKVEQLVNEQITANIDVTCHEMPLEQARKIGAMGIFDDKYGDKVKVYQIGDVSLEICGGPHATNTGKLGKFKIIKEEAVSSGVRRIKAICEGKNK